jgi:hypothetical protein
MKTTFSLSRITVGISRENTLSDDDSTNMDITCSIVDRDTLHTCWMIAVSLKMRVVIVRPCG